MRSTCRHPPRVGPCRTLTGYWRRREHGWSGTPQGLTRKDRGRPVSTWSRPRRIGRHTLLTGVERRRRAGSVVVVSRPVTWVSVPSVRPSAVRGVRGPVLVSTPHTPPEPGPGLTDAAVPRPGGRTTRARPRRSPGPSVTPGPPGAGPGRRGTQVPGRRPRPPRPRLPLRRPATRTVMPDRTGDAATLRPGESPVALPPTPVPGPRLDRPPG